MTLVVECVAACLAFTAMVLCISRDPIKTLYNYPPKIRERVRGLEEYRDQIPTDKDRVAAKLAASALFVLILALVVRYVNGCRTFTEAFWCGFALWTAVNLWDLVVLDICWFCHDPRFVFRGTEDMVSDYHDYLFHAKGFLIGEALALVVSALAALLACLLP